MSLVSHHFYAILPRPKSTPTATGEQVLAFLRKAVDEAALVRIGESAVELKPHGVSAVQLLKESHIAVHTWPELDRLTVDIHICDFSGDNLARARRLADIVSEACTSDPHWFYQRITDPATERPA